MPADRADRGACRGGRARAGGFRTDRPRGGLRQRAAGGRHGHATEYGLAAFVFTGDLNRALPGMSGLRCGMVGLNQGVVSNATAPFGGVKQSGLGREGGSE
ncbi:MAG: aldehyde dehydrogenase family protein [Actinophytocola sp.]|nr:aldehyde dehydrogenase family protein [Actinophytocola sp.]